MTPGTPDIAELKRMDAEADDGPWHYEPDNEGSSMGWIVNSRGAVLFKVAGDSAQQAVNAEHVVTMRSSFSSLLASAEENARLRAAIDKVTEACPKDNSEQDAFEAWAESQHFEMNQHPLHYLFLDGKTDAARQGWKAALSYVRAALAGSET